MLGRICPKLFRANGRPRTHSPLPALAYLDAEFLSWRRVTQNPALSDCWPEAPTPASEPPVLGSLSPPVPAALSAPPAPLVSAPIYVSHFHVDVWVCECQCCCHSKCVSHPSCCHPSPVPREGGRKPGGKTRQTREQTGSGEATAPCSETGEREKVRQVGERRERHIKKPERD